MLIVCHKMISRDLICRNQKWVYLIPSEEVWLINNCLVFKIIIIIIIIILLLLLLLLVVVLIYLNSSSSSNSVGLI